MKKSSKKLLISVFLTIFFILLVINIYLLLSDTSLKLTFTDLFTTLAESRRIDTGFISLAFQSGITENWGAFNFARNFINGLWSILGVVLYVCTNILNGFLFLFELIKKLFVGVLG